MKTILILGSVLALSVSMATQKSALQSVVETELAFAKASEEMGTRPAFLAFIAEDGVLYRPTAVNGKKWMLDHPLPASEKRPLLAWYPVYADIALAGDMGITFGPWEYKENQSDQKPSAYGHFATVWKKQSNGEWKFVIDHGISHPQPTAPIAPWQLPSNYKPKPWKPSNVDVDATRATLLDHDRTFSRVSSTLGIAKAFLAYSAADVRLFRNHNYPFAGRDAAVKALSKTTPPKHELTWEPIAGDVSQSDDLGYTHGTYTLATTVEPKKITERGNYVRFWKKHKGVWKVVVDLADPLPAEKK